MSSRQVSAAWAGFRWLDRGSADRTRNAASWRRSPAGAPPALGFRLQRSRRDARARPGRSRNPRRASGRRRHRRSCDAHRHLPRKHAQQPPHRAPLLEPLHPGRCVDPDGPGGSGRTVLPPPADRLQSVSFQWRPERHPHWLPRFERGGTGGEEVPGPGSRRKVPLRDRSRAAIAGQRGRGGPDCRHPARPDADQNWRTTRSTTCRQAVRPTRGRPSRRWS